MTDTDLLDQAAELASRAAALILRIRARGFATHAKLDESPVTEADHAAETIILEGLRRPVAGHAPIPVIAEEEVAAGHQVQV